MLSSGRIIIGGRKVLNPLVSGVTTGPSPAALSGIGQQEGIGQQVPILIPNPSILRPAE
jgi:hypothetical protein